MNKSTHPTTKLSHEPPRFDWYSATVEVNPLDLIDHLSVVMRAEPRVVKGPTLGYARRIALRRDDQAVAVVLAGGQPGAHVIGSGQDAVEVSGVVRRLWPDHAVSRADVCVDSDAGKAGYEWASAVLHDLAGLRCKTREERSSQFGYTARTTYIGSRSSETYQRLYEKGMKEAVDTRPDWLRWEVEVKPQNPERKRVLSRLSPVDAAGWSRLSSAALLDLFELDSVPASPRQERLGDDAKAERAMVSQYGQVLARLALKYGGWKSYGARLGGLVEERYPDAPRVLDDVSRETVAAQGE